MSGTPTIRGLSMMCAALAIGFSTSRSLATDDPWPLVNAADLAVWGTLVYSSSGAAPRLLVIAPDGADQPPLRFVDFVAGLPEGTELPPRARGLYLATTTDPRDPGLPAIAGTILTGGFIPGWPAAAVRERIARLASAGPFAEADALALLASDWSPARALALGWWRTREEEPSPAARAALAASLAGAGPEWLRPALEVFLARGWAVPAGGLAALVARAEDPVLADLALRAIDRDGGAEARAELILAWPDAPAAARARLLAAYARLGLAESLPWWLEALESADPEVLTVAIRELGRAGFGGAPDAYRRLLAADDPRIVSLALEGLANSGSAECAAILREFRAGCADDDPLGRQADRLLAKPRRYGARHPRPSPLESDGR